MRSPASPRSARACKSPVPINRPSGILPAGKVFHTPPPAVEARAPSGCSSGALCAGETGCAGAIGGGDASATAGGAEGDGAGIGEAACGDGGETAAIPTGVGPTGNARFATIVGAGLSEADGNGDGACATAFCLLASFPRFGDGDALASFPPL